MRAEPRWRNGMKFISLRRIMLQSIRASKWALRWFVSARYVFTSSPVKQREKQEFYGLLKPYDTAGFWDLLPEPTETGWIALSEEMTRRIIDEEARLSFKVGYILFLQDGVLLLEDSPFERKGGTI